MSPSEGEKGIEYMMGAVGAGWAEGSKEITLQEVLCGLWTEDASGPLVRKSNKRLICSRCLFVCFGRILDNEEQKSISHRALIKFKKFFSQ